MTSFVTLNAELKTQTTREISVDCIDTEREFEALGNEWNRLLLAVHRPVPFLTWEWISTWWQHFGSKSRLFVVVARNLRGEIVGIAPLHVVVRKQLGLLPVRCIEFLGYRGSAVCTDHLDFLAAPEQRVLINQLLLNDIVRRQDEWDCLALTDLAEDSLIPNLLPTVFVGETRIVPAEKCPYLELPEQWQTLLGSMKKKHRSELKRRREKLKHGRAVDFEISNEPGRTRSNLEQLGGLHFSSRCRHGQTGNFELPAYREFHFAVAERMARVGFLYIARLSCQHELVASLYGFHCAGRLFGYQTGFDSSWASQGVGSILQNYVLEDAIGRLHAIEYDFLRGTEEYKYSWTDRERVTKSLFAWRPSLKGRLLRTGFVARNRIALLRRTSGEGRGSPAKALMRSSFSDHRRVSWEKAALNA